MVSSQRIHKEPRTAGDLPGELHTMVWKAIALDSIRFPSRKKKAASSPHSVKAAQELLILLTVRCLVISRFHNLYLFF